MQAQRNETQNVTGANRPVSLRSSSLPAPSTDGPPFSATSFAAQSLIDEQSLPSWMQEGGASTSLPPEGGIPAANLVDKGSVPDWMKSLQQQSIGTGMGQPEQVPSIESTVKKVESVSPSSSLTSGFAARDLVDQQSLPSWMAQLGNQNPATSASRDQLVQPESFSQSAVNEPPPPIQPGQHGFAARDLIDQQLLPSWMLPQSGQNVAAPTNREQEKPSDQPLTGLPASSLLDMNALPSWMAENRQAQAVSPTHSQLPSSMVSSGQPWPAQEPIAPGSAADSSSGQGGRLEASSVIDMNALPDWLRSSGGGQQSVSETSSQSYSAPYAGPPRVETLRVPSRPRGEISSSETSEMAASVFASMLGVASTTPNFPPSTDVPYQQQPRQLSYIEQMTLSGVSGMAGMPSMVGMSTAGIGNPAGASMAGMSGGPGAQSMVGIAGGPGAQSMAGMSGGPGAQSMVGIAGGPGAQSMAGNVYGNPTGGLTGPSTLGMADEEKNAKKRGLFGALLDWLSR